MVPHLSIRQLEQRRQRRLGLIKFLLLAGMILLFYVLADSMLQHRFFQGGWMNPNNYPHADEPSQ